MKEELSSMENLFRKCKITSKIRFGCSRRLNFLRITSQFSNAIASIALIAIPLSEIFGTHSDLSVSQIAQFEIIFAIWVLVSSLLVFQDNLAIRSDQMHKCGLDLSGLQLKIYPFLSLQFDMNKYSELEQEYNNILLKYENHSEIDRLLYCISEIGTYFPKFSQKLWALFRLVIMFITSLLPQFFLLSITVFFFIRFFNS